MKWLTLAGILLYLSRYGDAGALKCSPKSQDPSCAPEKRDSSPPSRSPSPDAECQPGSEWDSNCHYCRCSESGVAECLKQDFCDLQVFDEPIRCKPNTTFQRSCNTCTCLENGLGLCTLMGCIDFPIPDTTDRRKRQAPVQTESKKCEPGSIWNVNCNTCFCTNNGNAICTAQGCLSFNIKPKKRETSGPVRKVIKHHNIVKRGVCKANQEFQVDCNPCKCAANGQSYTCTHNECLEGDNMNKEVEVFMESEGSDHIERHSVCKPRDTFYIGCNSCHCNPYGTDYSCTNKPCPLPKDVEIFHELNEMKPIIPYKRPERAGIIEN